MGGYYYIRNNISYYIDRLLRLYSFSFLFHRKYQLMESIHHHPYISASLVYCTVLDRHIPARARRNASKQKEWNNNNKTEMFKKWRKKKNTKIIMRRSRNAAKKIVRNLENKKIQRQIKMWYEIFFLALYITYRPTIVQ